MTEHDYESLLSGKCRLRAVEQEYDDRERSLLQAIDTLRRDYERAAKPYIDALVKSRASKPPTHYVVVPNNDAPQQSSDNRLLMMAFEAVHQRSKSIPPDINTVLRANLSELYIEDKQPNAKA